MNAITQILIIDAEPKIPDNCKQILTDQGFTVQESLGGLEVLEYLAQNNFDLILLDIGGKVRAERAWRMHVLREHQTLQNQRNPNWGQADQKIYVQLLNLYLIKRC